MRRIATLGLVVVLAAVAALVVGTTAQGSNTYKFDVIFDDARGLISGQQVKIAGASAGTINNVVVTHDDKARVEATISGPFQFHKNASCIIRPDGLIAENYLDCDPGSDSKPLLEGTGGYPPTVPVSQTSEPVSLLDLFDIFNLPTRERFQALVDELGIATAGNGGDINAILQRANPTLQSAQRVITILNGQTQQISTAIQDTNIVAQSGANHIASVKAFINQANGLSKLTADHSSSLEQAINKLPGFLSASTPALKQLNTVAVDGTPLLASLRASVPYLKKVNNDIVPFTKIATPALASVSKAINTAIPDSKAIEPLVKTLSNYLIASKGTTAQFAKLIDNLIDSGFSEDFLSVLYYTATALAKHDSDSHMLSALLMFPDNGGCGSYSTTVQPACNAHYGQAAAYTPARKTTSTTATTSTTTTATVTTPSGVVTTTTSTATTPSTTATNPVSSLGSGLANLGSTVASGVSGVVSGLGSTVSGLTGNTSTTNGDTGSSQTSTTSLSNLLNYLLK